MVPSGWRSITQSDYQTWFAPCHFLYPSQHGTDPDSARPSRIPLPNWRLDDRLLTELLVFSILSAEATSDNALITAFSTARNRAARENGHIGNAPLTPQASITGTARRPERSRFRKLPFEFSQESRYSLCGVLQTFTFGLRALFRASERRRRSMWCGGIS